MNYRSVFVAAAQTVGLFVAGFVIPAFGQILALFTPVPLIMIHVRDGRIEGLTVLAVSVVVVAVIAGWQAAAILLFSFGLMAIGTAEGMRKKWRPEFAALLGGLLPIAALGVFAAYYFGHAGKDPVMTIEAYLRSSVAEAAKLYTRLGLADMAAAVTSMSDAFIHYLVRLLPGIAVATSVLQAACCYGLGRAILARKKGVEPAHSFAAWHAPDTLVWGLIGTLVLIMVSNETVKFTGWNLAILYALMYLAQGMAIAEHYLRKAGIKPVVRGLIHALILVLPPIVACVIALGVVDIWADFRKVRAPMQTT